MNKAMAPIFRNQVVLVVGGAGFVGSNLVHTLLNDEPEQIIVIDNLLSSDPINIPDDKRVKFIFGSITDDRIVAAIPPTIDFAFHLACYHGNQSSIANPLADHENNALTSLKLFELLKDSRKLKKVVYAAAACAVAEKTFGQPTATTEDQPVSLLHDSPYSISKLIGELYGNYYFQRYKLPVIKARFSNVYGPREILGAGQWRGTVHTVWRNVTPTFIWRALNGESLQVDNGGVTSRDFIYVGDIVRGLISCALRGLPGQVYNLATGQETSILELASTINELTGNSAALSFRPAREWDRSGKRFASTAKAKKELGFQAEVDIRDGLRRTIEWTQANVGVISAAIARHRKHMQLAENAL